MSEPIYVVLFHVRAKELPTVLSVVEKSATLISVRPTEETKAPPEKKRQRYVNSKHRKDISGQDLVLQTLTEHKGVCDTIQLSKAFVNHGFANDSYSSAVTYLVKNGKVRRLERGRVALIGTTIHKGAGA